MERNQYWIIAILGVFILMGVKIIGLGHNGGSFSATTAAGFAPGLDDGIVSEISERLQRPKDFDGGQSAHLHSEDTIKAKALALRQQREALTQKKLATPLLNTTDSNQDPKKTKLAQNSADKKKKAKKKKKKIAPGQSIPQAEAEPEFAYEDATDSTKKSDDAFAAGGIPPSPSVQSTQTRLAGHMNRPETQEDWEEYLLRNPNEDKTARFIHMFQSGLVSNKIFFNIIEQMVSDSRSPMVRLGINAAGSNPNPQSFIILSALKSDPSLDGDLRSQVQRHLQTYAQLKNITYLIEVLRLRSGTSAEIEALRLLRMSAEIHYQRLISNETTAIAATDSGNSGSEGRAPSSGAEDGSTTTEGINSGLIGDANLEKNYSDQVVTQFNLAVPVVARLSETTEDAGLKDAALSALTNIQSIVGTEAT